MRRSKTEVYLHLVWQTYQRMPLLTAEVEPPVYACILAECRRLRCDVLAIGGTEDHVHLAVKLPGTLGYSKLMQQVKGISSHFAHERFGEDTFFRCRRVTACSAFITRTGSASSPTSRTRRFTTRTAASAPTGRKPTRKFKMPPDPPSPVSRPEDGGLSERGSSLPRNDGPRDNRDDSNAVTTIAAITARLEAKNAARERALAESRQVIRHAANTIRALHRGEQAQAEELLEQGRQRVAGLRAALAEHPDIYWAGYVQDALKEHAEAHLLRALVENHSLPSPTDLGVEDAPYLNGLAEAASELRRYILDMLRKGAAQGRRAEALLESMDEVYSQLITVDYPDAVTGGLRRTTDQLRGVLERTRGDLTLTIRQMELEAALRHQREE